MKDRDGRPIFLIGYRGTGKTTVGRELAARLGYEAIDADELVEQRAAKSIVRIFAEGGEAAFRQLEAEAIASLSQMPRKVISLGGGAILRDENRSAITTAGPVVWLTASVDAIVARLATDTSTVTRRPDLTKTGGRAEIETLLAARTPLYRECATLVVATDHKSPGEVADEIVARM